MGKVDTHWVKSDDVVKYLMEYLEKHEKKFPSRRRDTGTRITVDIPFYSGMRYLADQMTLNGGTHRSNFNKVERIRKNLCKWVSLAVADQILTATGDSYLLGYEIPIYERRSYNAEPVLEQAAA